MCRRHNGHNKSKSPTLPEENRNQIKGKRLHLVIEIKVNCLLSGLSKRKNYQVIPSSRTCAATYQETILVAIFNFTHLV